MAVTTKTLYDSDFVAWTAQIAELLRAGRFDEIDAENVAEEIEDLGKSERRAIESQMIRLMMHLIKQRIQPERDSGSWRGSIVDAAFQIRRALEASPSLRRHVKADLQELYVQAVRQAIAETGVTAELPEQCPYTLDELLSM